MRIHELLTLNEGTFTPEKKQRALELWDQGKSGLSDKKIADEVGVSKSTVSIFLNKEWGVSNPNTPRPTHKKVSITDEKKTQILNLWNKEPRPSDKEIADEVGVSQNTVSIFLNKEWKESNPNTPRPTLRPPLTPEKKTQILNLWNKEPRPVDKEIADEVGVDPDTVRRFLNITWKESNPNTPRPTLRPPLTDEKKTQILNLWNKDPRPSDKEIADEVGVSQNTVNRFLNIIWKESNPNTPRPTLNTRFSELEITTMKNLYMEGYGPTYIASQLTKLYGVLRLHGTVNTAIRRQPDYETLLRPRHLENLKILVGTSQMEIDFFNDLQKKLEQAFPNNIINLERNLKVFRNGKKLFYQMDGLINEKLVVEFNGTLWHADPLEIYKRGDRRGQQKYPDDKFIKSMGVTAGETRQYDNERTKWLATHYGIEPVIIWEREWTNKSTKQECIDRVIDRVSKIVN